MDTKSPAFITNASISVANDEFPTVTHDRFVHDIVDDFRRTSEPIPSAIHRYGNNLDGITTQAQVAQTKEHTHALQLHGFGRSSDRLWFGLYYFSDYPNPGFAVHEHGESIILSYDSEIRKSNHRRLPIETPPSPPWQIEIPRLLSY